MKWFKHDSDANADAKLMKLRIKYGMEGYGLYWYCLECIARNVDKNNLTFELEHDSEIISHDTGIHIERVQEMMQFMVSLNLFESDNGVVSCIKMAIRLDDTTSRHPKIKELQDSLRSNPEERPKLLRSNPEETSSRTDKNRTEQNRKDKRFIPPTLDQVREYCLSRNNNVDPEKFINHYETNGWMRGKTKIKDWKACVRTWEGGNETTGGKRAI